MTNAITEWVGFVLRNMVQLAGDCQANMGTDSLMLFLLVASRCLAGCMPDRKCTAGSDSFRVVFYGSQEEAEDVVKL